MSSDQFFYWLQGYFELSNTDKPLSDEQAECINRHIDLVAACLNKQLPERIIEIRVLLTLLSNDRALITGRIQNAIKEQFIHVIDPKAGDEKAQANFNQINGGPGGGQPVYRC